MHSRFHLLMIILWGSYALSNYAFAAELDTQNIDMELGVINQDSVGGAYKIQIYDYEDTSNKDPLSTLDGKYPSTNNKERVFLLRTIGIKPSITGLKITLTGEYDNKYPYSQKCYVAKNDDKIPTISPKTNRRINKIRVVLTTTYDPRKKETIGVACSAHYGSKM